jgi:hypothetical protein
MQRTVKAMRSLLKPAKTRYVAWGVLHRKAVYGATERAVRKQLVTIVWCGKSITVHRKEVVSLKRVEDRIRRKEKAKGYKTWTPRRVDTFNWRPVRGGKSLSRHAHAIALDIDPESNRMHAHYNGVITTTLPARVVQAFIDEGWSWGGNWTAPCDPMHMQRHHHEPIRETTYDGHMRW